jgi:Uma2 family endonuclease
MEAQDAIPGLLGTEELAANEPSAWSPEVRRQLIEWLSFPAGTDVEQLHGKITHRAIARGEHGAAQGAIYSQMYRLRSRPGGREGWWLTMEVDLYLAGQGVRPDVAGWHADKHPAPPRADVNEHLGVVVVAPDLVCEVLSTSTAARDKGTKRKAYQRSGVEWYWLVDLLSEEIHVFHRTQRSYELIETAYGDTPGCPAKRRTAHLCGACPNAPAERRRTRRCRATGWPITGTRSGSGGTRG